MLLMLKTVRRFLYNYQYGTCPECSTRALITRPSVSKLLLISPASLALPCNANSMSKVLCRIWTIRGCIWLFLVYYEIQKLLTSLAPERDIFSEPARSTRLSFPILIISSPSWVSSLIWIVIENMECDLLLCLFSSVSAVRLFAEPLSRIL